MYYIKLIQRFIQASNQHEVAHGANYWFSLLNALLNLLTGIFGVAVIFGQIESINGWDYATTLIILGV
jgi:ABC-type uncharacterized transport system permease subunit